MNKPLLRYLFPAAAVLAGLAYSCSERLHAPDAPSPDLPHFTLAEVKRAFAEEYAAVPGTRTGGEFDENAVLDPLRIDPAWDAVSFLDCDTLSQAVVPFGARYDYRLLRWDEQGHPSLTPLPHRLVVVKDSDTGRTPGSTSKFGIRTTSS